MGLFDFVKEAGEKIFGNDESAAAPQTRDVDPARLEQLKRNKALQNLVGRFGLEVEGLKVEVESDTAVVHGQVDSQAERERVVLALGNVAGIARVDDRLESATKSPEARMHTVILGDTLSKIAKKYYGDATLYPAIFEANRPMLSDPDRIYPGQVLRVPALGA